MPLNPDQSRLITITVRHHQTALHLVSRERGRQNPFHATNFAR
ncbi:Uncharacterised protein [Vibrio cholerae]|nr:Uncharacterised protein [Vibrio cholerae]